VKHSGTNNTAGFEPVADVSRLRDRHGFCAYPWQLGTGQAGIANARAMVIADSKLHHRWPEESLP